MANNGKENGLSEQVWSWKHKMGVKASRTFVNHLPMGIRNGMKGIAIDAFFPELTTPPVHNGESLQPGEAMEMARQIEPGKFPKTVMVVLDKNRTYGRDHGLTVDQAHEVGAEAFRNTVLTLEEFEEVERVIAWTWSEDNNKRDEKEKHGVHGLMTKYLQKYGPELHEKGYRIKHIGWKNGMFEEYELVEGLDEEMKNWEEHTRNNTGREIVIAAMYGPIFETKQLADSVADFVVSNSTTDPETGDVSFDKNLLSPGVVVNLQRRSWSTEPPDATIRPIENRLSGLTISAFSELLIIPKTLPEIGPDDVALALVDYSKRVRTFGSDKASDKPLIAQKLYQNEGE